MTFKKKQLYFIGGITWNLAGLRGITRDLAGLRGITRDYAGFGGIWRDYAGFGGITRDLAGLAGLAGLGVAPRLPKPDTHFASQLYYHLVTS